MSSDYPILSVIETTQLICRANLFIGFYMIGTLVPNELNNRHNFMWYESDAAGIFLTKQIAKQAKPLNSLPSWYLLVPSQWWQHQNVWNLFKVHNKDIRTTSLRHRFGVSIFHSEQVLHIFLMFSSLSLTHSFPMHPFSTPWKHLTVFWCFQGVGKGCIGNEWVKKVNIYYYRNWSGYERISHQPN